MANTRFNYDPCRTVKKLQEATDIGRYMLNTPGNGLRPSFIEDPHIVPQKWGGNLLKHSVQIESTLFGITEPLQKGDIETTWNMKELYEKDFVQYPIDAQQITFESRTLYPAWEIRNVYSDRWDYLPTNPQKHVIPDFKYNIDTRNSVKDYYLHKV